MTITDEQFVFSEHLRKTYGDVVAYNYLVLVNSPDYANRVDGVREFRFRKCNNHLRSDLAGDTHAHGDGNDESI